MRQLHCGRHPLRNTKPQETTVNLTTFTLHINLFVLMLAPRNTDLLPGVTPEEPIGDGGEQNTSPRPFNIRGQSIEGETPALRPKRRRHEVLSDNHFEADTGSNAQLTPSMAPPSDLTREEASESHTVISPPHHNTSSETLRLQPLPEPSDAAEDSSAYAETLEGGSSGKHGVPFYPGMCLPFGLPSPQTPLSLITREYFRHY